jgi:hypothetical protein
VVIDGPTHYSAAELVKQVFAESACLTGLSAHDPTNPHSSHDYDNTVPLSFFNFVCVRGRRVSWPDAARELEAIKQYRRSLPPQGNAWEFCDDEEVVEAEEDQEEPTTLARRECIDNEDAVTINIDSKSRENETVFIPQDTRWLPDCHIRYAYCPIAYHPSPPSQASSQGGQGASSSTDVASATLVSSNTRTYSRYLRRVLRQFVQLPEDVHDLYTEDTLLLHEAESNLCDLLSEYSRH